MSKVIVATPDMTRSMTKVVLFALCGLLPLTLATSALASDEPIEVYLPNSKFRVSLALPRCQMSAGGGTVSAQPCGPVDSSIVGDHADLNYLRTLPSGAIVALSIAEVKTSIEEVPQLAEKIKKGLLAEGLAIGAEQVATTVAGEQAQLLRMRATSNTGTTLLSRTYYVPRGDQMLLLTYTIRDRQGDGDEQAFDACIREDLTTAHADPLPARPQPRSPAKERADLRELFFSCFVLVIAGISVGIAKLRGK